jgi:hypothetical protein
MALNISVDSRSKRGIHLTHVAALSCCFL